MKTTKLFEYRVIPAGFVIPWRVFKLCILLSSDYISYKYLKQLLIGKSLERNGLTGSYTVLVTR